MSQVTDPPLVTLLTDYGLSDSFVGVLHAVVAGICPQARVIDLGHGVARQDVRGGAITLAQAMPYTPVGVHVAIVDPTVGSERRAVALETRDGRIFIGPDNGLLWPAAEASGGAVRAVEISRSRWRLEPLSATFHGRDLFAPVAAHLAAGEPLARAGDTLDCDALARLASVVPQLRGGVLTVAVGGVDGFGNVQLQAGAEDLRALGLESGDGVRILPPSGAEQTATVARTFADVAPGRALVFLDSAARLAIAVNGGSAAAGIGLRVGDQVQIRVGAGA